VKLFFITGSFPYGVGEQWKLNEIKELSQHFDEITIIPYNYHGNFASPKSLPQGIKVEKPLYRTDSFSVTKGKVHKLLFNKYRSRFLKEFFGKKVYGNRKNMSKWMLYSFNAIRLLNHETIKKMLAQADKDTVLYFYWGRGISEIVPFIDTSRFRKVVIRMHRFDLYEDINDGYIPYRGQLMLNTTAFAAPCSESGRKHLASLYPAARNQPVVMRIGTTSNGRRSNVSTDGVLRIVSCSMLSVVKRVRIMIESLALLKMPVIWHHIGDGELRKELEKLVKERQLEDKFIFKGLMNSEDIHQYYTENTFDLFINVSASEGVPVSIMEAFAAGIPVLATDVGGTSEIVDETVGGLLPARLEGEELAKQITEFYSLSEQDKLQKRQNAYDRFQCRCDGQKLAKELANFLTN
jgi:colanic acid/amylovoran biosynthesis glycosyltransferase